MQEQKAKRNKLSTTELKILVYKRVQNGMPYDEAVKQVTAELQYLNNNNKYQKRKTKIEDFKEEFTKLKLNKR